MPVPLIMGKQTDMGNKKSSKKLIKKNMTNLYTDTNQDHCYRNYKNDWNEGLEQGLHCKYHKLWRSDRESFEKQNGHSLIDLIFWRVLPTLNSSSQTSFILLVRPPMILYIANVWRCYRRCRYNGGGWSIHFHFNDIWMFLL